MKRVLLLGRKNCSNTIRLINHLEIAGFDVDIHLSDNRRGVALPDEVQWWEGDYIFSFRSLCKVPKSLLDRASEAAINFHPGPPEYPGGGCTNHALLNHERTYGVTAHIMNEKIDDGNILKVARFPVYVGDNITSLLGRTHLKLLDLALDIIDQIAIDGRDAINDLLVKNSASWSGRQGRISEIDSLSRLTPDMCLNKMRSIIRAAHTDNFPVKMIVNGLEFVFQADKANE